MPLGQGWKEFQLTDERGETYYTHEKRDAIETAKAMQWLKDRKRKNNKIYSHARTKSQLI